MIKTELPKSYTPAEAEGEILTKWEQSRAFHASPGKKPRDGSKPFCIVIPPPNVTAPLHLGHALNNTVQDVLTRYHRMRGELTLWMPGTDHAGIATQAVVEKRLIQTEGKKRIDFERDAFIERVQAWKDEYEATILSQLKAMGCSCDFERTRFTMDEVCAKAVREAFFRLFKAGLIYRGKRLVNWDPVTLTALADDEVEMKEVDGHFWYLRYPLVHPPRNPGDPGDCQEVTWSELAARGYPGAERHPDDENAWVTVATTRPETYLGDTAVAVNPDDPRAAALKGLMAQLPLVGRVIPVIEDDYVVMPDAHASDAKAQFATGFLKVTPAHDPNDYEIGLRHDLHLINVMAPDASISDRHGWDDLGDAKLFLGKSREEARKLVVKEFEARGLLESVKPYRHSVGHSYRSHVPIEPYLSDQWYVRVTDDRMKGEALRAMADEQHEGEKPPRAPDRSGDPGAGDGELRFFPARYARTFQHWHENLRDWCISRQLWWGHRIPVWHKRVTLTEDNWTVELLAWGWDSYVRGNWNGDGIEVRIVRVSDGAVVDPASDALMPITKQTKGEYDIFICLRDEETPLKSQISASGFAQDPDVLDTWFSSALWPISTMGWPDPEAFPDEFPEGKELLETFNPSSVLCTGREIITLWVSRMVMFNRFFRDGVLPFHHVYIHAMIQDGYGQKMSKSLGNGVDPRDIIHTHGADALRFTLSKLATSTQDVRLPVDILCPHCEETFEPKEIITPAGYRVAAPELACAKCSKAMTSSYGVASGLASPTDAAPLARNSSRKFDEGRNFANKLWNASRFALSHLNDEGLPHASSRVNVRELSLVDRWMLSRLHHAQRCVERAIGEYQFNAYADTMYDLVWREFCDWYLEAIKPTIKVDAAQQHVLRTVLNAVLRLLHPIMPFVTEALWPHVCDAGEAGLEGIELPPGDLLATAAWPRLSDLLRDDDAERTFSRAQQLIDAIRAIRGERNITWKQKLTLHVKTEASLMEVPPEIKALFDVAGSTIRTLAGLRDAKVDCVLDSGQHSLIPLAFEGHDLYLSGLAADGSSDVEAERARLTKLIEEKQRAVQGFESRLANENYVKKAPPHLVEETMQQLAAAQADLAAARRAIESLGSGT